jgi:hypothetical protein
MSEPVVNLVPVWPIDLLQPERPHWEIVTGIVTGGQNLEGFTQTGILGGGGYWQLILGRIVTEDLPEQLFAWRAIQALLDGGASPFILGWPDWAGMEEIWPADYADALTFSDGTAWSDGAYWTPGAIRIVNIGGAPKNATSMVVGLADGPPLQAGMIFSVLDAQGLPRRHDIRRVTPVDGQPTQFTIKFRPWLRDAVADTQELNFSNPSSVMFLADPKSVFADQLGSRFAEVSPIFNEWFGTWTP